MPANKRQEPEEGMDSRSPPWEGTSPAHTLISNSGLHTGTPYVCAV